MAERSVFDRPHDGRPTVFLDVVIPELDPAERWDVVVSGQRIGEVLPARPGGPDPAAHLIEGRGLWLLAGFIDDHVHLREPGREHEEGYASGTRAAAAGGVTTLLEVQDDRPLMTSREAVEAKLEQVRPRAVVNVGVYGTLVPETLSEVGAMSDLVAGYKLAMGPSDDGLGVTGDEQRRALFSAVATTGHWLFVHAEDGATLAEGLGRHGDAGAAGWHLARPAAAEVLAVQESVALGEACGTRVHLFHLSTAGAADLVASARAGGQPVTAGTCPHYLYFDHEDTARLGALLRVDPSIKTRADGEALVEGLRSGDIDCLASDHGPHPAEAKARPFAEAPSGIPCLDIFMPLCLTLVKRGLLDLATVLERASATPAALHGFAKKGRVAAGLDADLVLVDPDGVRAVRGAEHFSKAKQTPYEGLELVGWPQLTMVMGRVVHVAEGRDEVAVEA